MRDISCAILAGGASARFERDKALLEVGKETLIQRIARHLAKVTDDLLIVGNDLERFRGLDARMIPDSVSGVGALGGICTALESARHTYVFVAACDLPFLDMNLVRYMVLLAPGYDVVMPYVRGEAEPLHAIYAKTCLAPMRGMIEAGERRIVPVLPQVRVRDVRDDEIQIFDPEFRSFFNLNTPKDLEKMETLLREHKV
jgi:molybdopterin-guanine dinucleotide biosynthesis protein A